MNLIRSKWIVTTGDAAFRIFDNFFSCYSLIVSCFLLSSNVNNWVYLGLLIPYAIVLTLSVVLTIVFKRKLHLLFNSFLAIPIVIFSLSYSINNKILFLWVALGCSVIIGAFLVFIKNKHINKSFFDFLQFEDDIVKGNNKQNKVFSIIHVLTISISLGIYFGCCYLLIVVNNLNHSNPFLNDYTPFLSFLFISSILLLLADFFFIILGEKEKNLNINEKDNHIKWFLVRCYEQSVFKMAFFVIYGCLLGFIFCEDFIPIASVFVSLINMADLFIGEIRTRYDYQKRREIAKNNE